MISATLSFRVGQAFYPTPHYRETIAALALSEDRRTLVVETLENRTFRIPVPLAAARVQPPAERGGLPRLIRRLASKASTSST